MGSKWMYQVGTWSVAGALFYAFVYLKDRKARVVDPKVRCGSPCTCMKQASKSNPHMQVHTHTSIHASTYMHTYTHQHTYTHTPAYMHIISHVHPSIHAQTHTKFSLLLVHHAAPMSVCGTRTPLGVAVLLCVLLNVIPEYPQVPWCCCLVGCPDALLWQQKKKWLLGLMLTCPVSCHAGPGQGISPTPTSSSNCDGPQA